MLARDDVLALMRRTGHLNEIDRARRVLPDPVDSDRDAELLDSLGLDKGGLMADLGDSP